MFASRRDRPTVLLLALAFSLLAGCAARAPRARSLGPSPGPADLSRYRELSVVVTAGSGVEILDHEVARLRDRIAAAVRAKQAGRFAAIHSGAPAAATPATLTAEVDVTRYRKGNRFARAMLAGLGQIHIDAIVRLKDASSGERLASYSVEKTFAWGGILGASTGIEEVEVGFADGVANAILGIQED